MPFSSDSIDLGKNYVSQMDAGNDMYSLWENIFDAGGFEYGVYEGYDSFDDIWTNMQSYMDVDYNKADLSRMDRENRLDIENLNTNFANQLSTTNEAMSQTGLSMGGGFSPLNQSPQALQDEGRLLSEGIKLGKRNYFEGIGNQMWDNYISIVDSITGNI